MMNASRCSLAVICFVITSAFPFSTERLLSTPPRKFLSLASSFEPDQETDYSAEETLLCVRFEMKPGIGVEEAKKQVSKYSQSFPFSAVLPVQPLMYLPTSPDDGVEVRFLRKKTEEKSSVDGGIRFFIETPIDREIELTAKRNSAGQTVAKIFAERLVITSYIAGLNGEADSRKRFGDPPTDKFVEIKSVFHKWMG